MKKILVSGCINCPYLTVYNNGQENGIDSISSGEYKHPSFHKELLNPIINSTVFIEYTVGEPALAISGKIKTPDWCPLPND